MLDLPSELRMWAKSDQVPLCLVPTLIQSAERIERLERAVHVRPAKQQEKSHRYDPRDDDGVFLTRPSGRILSGIPCGRFSQ
jgi:hypothetical protein